MYHVPSADIHRRYVRVLAGSLTDWVGVADATLSDFACGVVHGRLVKADTECVPSCPGLHSSDDEMNGRGANV